MNEVYALYLRFFLTYREYFMFVSKLLCKIHYLRSWPCNTVLQKMTPIYVCIWSDRRGSHRQVTGLKGTPERNLNWSVHVVAFTVTMFDSVLKGIGIIIALVTLDYNICTTKHLYEKSVNCGAIILKQSRSYLSASSDSNVGNFTETNLIKCKWKALFDHSIYLIFC